MEGHFIKAFEKARETYNLPKSISITYHESALSQLSKSVKFDAIVSPANSYARLDGTFDDALSRAFAPKEDYFALTRIAQAAVFKEYRGFAPPGSCMLIDLQGEKELVDNGWGCRYLALCPTMKKPDDVNWDREIVYECIWTLLSAVERHNRRVVAGEGKRDERGIKSVLMTPLATGCGMLSAEKWAAQTVIAMRQFVEAGEAGAGKSWGLIIQESADVKKTYDL
jgi:O-acetyl-ADP-ribose deacetylase (regulator of RNase III)